MNISNHINTWAKKILAESKNYNPTMEEFPQTDELPGMKDYEEKEEYEKWQKKRDEEMKGLKPKITSKRIEDFENKDPDEYEKWMKKKELENRSIGIHEETDNCEGNECSEARKKKVYAGARPIIERPQEDPEEPEVDLGGSESAVGGDVGGVGGIDEGMLGDIANSIKRWATFWRNSPFKAAKDWAKAAEITKANEGMRKLSEQLRACTKADKKMGEIRIIVNSSSAIKESNLNEQDGEDPEGPSQEEIDRINAATDAAAEPENAGKINGKYFSNATIMTPPGSTGQYVIFSTTNNEKDATTVEGLAGILRQKNLKNLKNVKGFLVLDTGDDAKKFKGQVIQAAKGIKDAKFDGSNIKVELTQTTTTDNKTAADVEELFTM